MTWAKAKSIKISGNAPDSGLGRYPPDVFVSPLAFYTHSSLKLFFLYSFSWKHLPSETHRHSLFRAQPAECSCSGRNHGYAQTHEAH